MEWTEEWPTKEGLYWFFGWLWGDLGLLNPDFHLVKAVRTMNSLSLILDGHSFMYKSEGHFGKFIPAELPVPPVFKWVVVIGDRQYPLDHEYSNVDEAMKEAEVTALREYKEDDKGWTLTVSKE